MRIPQGLPSGDSPEAVGARRLLILLGPAFNAPDGSCLADDHLALAGALALAHDDVTGAFANAFADSAAALLSELEAEYGLTDGSAFTIADRQVRLVAKIRAAFSGSPQDILSAVRQLVPGATLQETSAAELRASEPDGSPYLATTLRRVFRFTVALGDVADDPIKPTMVRALLEAMKPAHAGYLLVHESGGFFTDNPASLTDRTTLGH